MNGRLRARFRDHSGLLLLLGIAFAVYAQALGHSFLTTWDDDKYVVANRMIRGFGDGHLLDAFTGWSVGNYAPIQLLSYMADYTLWGMRPAGFIATNLLLHLGNGLLFHQLLRRLIAGKVAPLVATAVFLLHPVQVESVVWVSQRKNLLAMTFFLTALLCYLSYRQRPERERYRFYILSLAAFLLALLSKPVSAILPLALILSDYCHLPKGSWRQTLPDKVPFLAMTVIMSVVAVRAQGAAGGLPGFHGGSVKTTILTMLPVFCRYLELLFLPFRLSPVYAPPLRTGIDLPVLLAAAVLVSMLLAGMWLAQRRRHLLFWYGLFFLGLLPVSQVVPLVTLMNDRYLYFPLLGAATLAGTAAASLMEGSKFARGGGGLLLCSFLLLPLLSMKRVGVWKDDLSLWRDAVAKSPMSAEAWNGLGAAHEQRGNHSDAVAAYRRSLAMSPGMGAALNNLGVALMKQGELNDSRHYLLLLTERYPGMAEGFVNLALNYSRAGDVAAAEKAWLKALELAPSSPVIRLKVAAFYAGAAVPAPARFHYREALRLGGDPEQVKKGLLLLDTLYGGAETR